MSTNTQTGIKSGLDFSPVCDPGGVADFEKEARGWGVDRRIAFVVATKSRSELTDVVPNLAASDEEALFQMLDGIRRLIEHYQRSTELFSAVEARLFIAAQDAFDMPLD